MTDNRFILDFPSVALNFEEHLDQISCVGKASVKRGSVKIGADVTGIHNPYSFKSAFLQQMQMELLHLHPTKVIPSLPDQPELCTHTFTAGDSFVRGRRAGEGICLPTHNRFVPPCLSWKNTLYLSIKGLGLWKWHI